MPLLPIGLHEAMDGPWMNSIHCQNPIQVQRDSWWMRLRLFHLITKPREESNLVLAGKLAATTFGTFLSCQVWRTWIGFAIYTQCSVALAMVAGIPALTAFYFYQEGKEETGQGFNLPSIPGFGGKDGEGLSMADVKKYGVAGTVAYVLTELAFWAVAFPVASTALYQSTGHWPDVINDTTDRATVLGFIFAGANIARLLVPLRLGAALALAPWVDDNILSKFGKTGGELKSANI